MVFNVRCFQCGKHEVRLVLGGRSIIHARCHGCETNLLAEVMEFQRQIEEGDRPDDADPDDEPSPEDTSPEDTLDPVSCEPPDEEPVQPGSP